MRHVPTYNSVCPHLSKPPSLSRSRHCALCQPLLLPRPAALPFPTFLPNIYKSPCALTRNLVFLAQRDGGFVHHMQLPLQHISEGQVSVQHGPRVLHRVAVIHAINLQACSFVLIAVERRIERRTETERVLEGGGGRMVGNGVGDGEGESGKGNEASRERVPRQVGGGLQRSMWPTST